MKIAGLLCVIGACAPWALEAGAAESPMHGGSAAAVAEAGQVGRGTATGRDTPVKPGRAPIQESTPVGAGNGAGSKGRHTASAAPSPGPVSPTRGKGQLARSNTERLHALLSKSARGPAANSSHPPVASKRTAPTNRTAPIGSGVARARGLGGESSSGLRTLSVSNSAARLPTGLKAAARGSAIGGPRAAGAARLGGPTIPRTANTAIIDGTQVHRRF